MKNLAVLNLVLSHTKNKKWIIVMGKEIKKNLTSFATHQTTSLLSNAPTNSFLAYI